MSNDFRTAMRRFATGVTAVTTVIDTVAHGFTASAFTSVSADPPMVLICVNRASHSHSLIDRSRVFCVNVLAATQIEVARRFAGPDRETRFEGLTTHRAATGSPILDDALAWFDCTLAEEYTAGSHTIFVGLVTACGSVDGEPLGYFDGDYRDFGVVTGGPA